MSSVSGNLAARGVFLMPVHSKVSPPLESRHEISKLFDRGFFGFNTVVTSGHASTTASAILVAFRLNARHPLQCSNSRRGPSLFLASPSSTSTSFVAFFFAGLRLGFAFLVSPAPSPSPSPSPSASAVGLVSSVDLVFFSFLVEVERLREDVRTFFAPGSPLAVVDPFGGSAAATELLLLLAPLLTAVAEPTVAASSAAFLRFLGATLD